MEHDLGLKMSVSKLEDRRLQASAVNEGEMEKITAIAKEDNYNIKEEQDKDVEFPLDYSFHKKTAEKNAVEEVIEDESNDPEFQMKLKCLTCWNDFSEEKELNQHIINLHDGMAFCSVHNRTEPLAESCPKVPETPEYYRLVSSRRNSTDARATVKEEISTDDNDPPNNSSI